MLTEAELDAVAHRLFVQLIETKEFDALTPEDREAVLLWVTVHATNWILDRDEF